MRMRRDLAERFWEKVDRSGDCWLWTAFTDNGRYGRFNVDGRKRMAHRVAYELGVGPIPDGMMIDHKCGVRHCVNPDHLRPATRKQNGENLHGLPSNNTSGVLGVSWDKRNKKWIGSVTHHRLGIFVGRFVNLEEAEAAVTAKRLELFTHNEIDRMSA